MVYFNARGKHLLSDLDRCPPEILGMSAVALVTHLVMDDILHHKHLLENSPAHYLRVT